MAFVTLTKTPLLICSRRRSCKILRGLGAISLILLRRQISMVCKIASDVPPDSDDKVNLGLCWNVEVTNLAGSTLQADLLPLFREVLLDVGLGPLEDDLSLSF